MVAQNVAPDTNHIGYVENHMVALAGFAWEGYKRSKRGAVLMNVQSDFGVDSDAPFGEVPLQYIALVDRSSAVEKFARMAKGILQPDKVDRLYQMTSKYDPQTQFALLVVYPSGKWWLYEYTPEPSPIQSHRICDEWIKEQAAASGPE